MTKKEQIIMYESLDKVAHKLKDKHLYSDIQIVKGEIKVESANTVIDEVVAEVIEEMKAGNYSILKYQSL